MLPRLASRTDLIHANGRLAALTSSGEQVVGPALGGVLFQSASSLPFIGNLASFLLSAGLLAALPATPADTTAGRRELKTEIAEALHWYRGALALRWLTGFVCLIALGQAMLLSLLVLFGIEQLGLTARGFGLVLGLIALGNVFGGLIAERLWSLLRTSHVLVLCGQIIALSTAAVALTKTTWVAIVVLAAEAIAVVVCNVVTATYRQVVVPAALRGRVNSLFRSLLYGMGPIGGVLAGYVAHTSSIALAFRIAGGIQLAAVVLCGPALWKHLPMTGRELTATPD